MRRPLSLPLAALLLAVSFTACETPQSETLVIYSGRSESLVEPIIERFKAATGIEVEVRYGGTAQLAVALTEEGDQSPADLFWAQDAGALGAVQQAGLLATLPDSLLTKIPDHYRNGAGTWVATSGRARTLAYAPDRVDASNLPQSIFDLADPAYQGRVGWAPANGSFQAHVTALRQLVGDDSTRAWLEAMNNNGTKTYPNNRSIVQAIADGEIDLGLPNHYYLLRFKDSDPDFPVEQAFFAPGDPGNLVNVAGVGVLKYNSESLRFVDFLLSDEAQQYFIQETHEYAIRGEAASNAQLSDVQASLDLDGLRDLEATLTMLRDVGLL
ncbi:MAG: iron ABC transporter substrate-binding protein [Rhodothermales bacterium]